MGSELRDTSLHLAVGFDECSISFKNLKGKIVEVELSRDGTSYTTIKHESSDPDIDLDSKTAPKPSSDSLFEFTPNTDFNLQFKWQNPGPTLKLESNNKELGNYDRKDYTIHCEDNSISIECDGKEFANVKFNGGLDHTVTFSDDQLKKDRHGGLSPTPISKEDSIRVLPKRASTVALPFEESESELDGVGICEPTPSDNWLYESLLFQK
jgi:hypothetical protein